MQRPMYYLDRGIARTGMLPPKEYVLYGRVIAAIALREGGRRPPYFN
ncbi:MAG: hypothetical protein GDA56_09800 [Hormoscilla sp. GM7CHS1pb]|nr:hypothetical protein [Hormoscilla sp. GM7CHS1pb]